jgi:hypothetical protein
MNDATRLLRIAAAGCSKAPVQWTAAMAEFKALGATP